MLKRVLQRYKREIGNTSMLTRPWNFTTAPTWWGSTVWPHMERPKSQTLFGSPQLNANTTNMRSKMLLSLYKQLQDISKEKFPKNVQSMLMKLKNVARGQENLFSACGTMSSFISVKLSWIGTVFTEHLRYVKLCNTQRLSYKNAWNLLYNTSALGYY